MKKSLIVILFFLMLSTLQNSFFASLPGYLPLLPLIFTVGIYLLQHQSQTMGAWLIIGNGLYLDYYRLQSVPAESIAYLITAVTALYLAKHIFSNRSLYGVLACGLFSFVILKLSQFVLLGILWLRGSEPLAWRLFFEEAIWSAILMAVGLIVLFPFAAKIRNLLQKSFLLPQKETY